LTAETRYTPDFVNYKSYVEDSFVRFVESAGARAVPIVYLDVDEK
jgi:gamma-glutamyl hydrolase